MVRSSPSSHGQIPPISAEVRSETAIVAGLAQATLRDRHGIDWAAMLRDYDVIRDHISRVVPGCADYNAKTRTRDGFVLPNGPRDARRFDTATGRARITVNHLEHVHCPAGRLLLQTVRFTNPGPPIIRPASTATHCAPACSKLRASAGWNKPPATSSTSPPNSRHNAATVATGAPPG